MDLIPKWLKNKNASLAELKQQLEGAREAQATAIEAVASAQADFDADPSTQRKLVEAQDAERATLLHVQRAERLLADAQARTDAEERARLEHRAAELREQLSHEQLKRKRAAGYAEEVEALRAAIEARAKRVTTEEQIAQLERELKQVRFKLGESEQEVYMINTTPLHNLPMPSVAGIGDELFDEFRRLGADDLRMRCVSAMRSYLGNLR
jgi:hypothetical protein